MSKDVFRKGMVLGIILLFVGVSVLPNISGKNEFQKNDLPDSNMISYTNDHVPPMACFIYEYDGMIVNFDAGCSSDPDGGSIQIYAWDFDNNGADERWGETTSWDFSQPGWGPGSYRVALWIKDDEGQESLCRKDVHVPGGEGSDPPMPCFTFNYESDGYTVNFDAGCSSDPDGGSIQIYAWDFDNNGADERWGETTSWDFSQPGWGDGTYYVALWVKDDDEQQNICRSYMTVPLGGEQNNPPDAPTNPSPLDGATGVELGPTLSVDIYDPDGDSMDIKFYDESGSLIGTDTNVPSGSTASVTWSGLSYSTTYRWYVLAEDEEYSTRGPPSGTWSFTTREEENHCPNKPIITGATSGVVYNELEYTVKTSDPDGDSFQFDFEWGDGSTSALGPCYSNIEYTNTHSWNSADTYNVRVRAYDGDCYSEWSEVIVTIRENSPPNKPTITGPYCGYGAVGYTYWYNFCATDPDDDQVMYIIQWKGETETTTDFYDSGEEAKAYLIWPNPGTYNIRAKASDGGLESGWSDSYEVTIYEKLPDISLYYWPGWNFYILIEFESHEPEQGGLYRIGYVIENRGNDWIMEDEIFNIRFRRDGAILTTEEMDLRQNIAPGDISIQFFTEFDYKWPSDGDYHTISVEMDVYNDITEVYETNNYFERKYRVPPSCCFPAGTKITMADGSYKNIEDICPIDQVLSYDIVNCEFTSWRVKLLGDPVHPVYEINDGLLSFTKDHPIRVKKPDGTTGWGAVDINAAKTYTRLKKDILTIEIGDQVYTTDEEWIEITNIEFKPELVQTYNIMSFSGTKTYFANDVLVFEENPPLSIWRANNFYIRGYVEAWINALLDLIR